MANTSLLAAFERFWQHVVAKLDKKANSNHAHDDRYYTESEIDDKIGEVNSYIDSKTSGVATTSVVDTKISNHNTSTSAHSDIRGLISDLTTKLNNFLDVDDTTTDQLSEVLTLIENNKGTLDSITSSKINVSDIVDNMTTSSTSKVLSAKQGVAIKALIDDLQTAIDDTYEIAASHAANINIHVSSTERTKWNTAHSHSQSAHAPSNAEKNQNAFSNIVVGSTTIAADSVTDTLTLIGSNVTITPDATNDKVTISVADGSTSTKGIVQLTNSTSSTSTTTAATPNSVKSAYDLANTANTTAQTAKDIANSKADVSHAHAIADVSGLQSALDGKAASSHGTHVTYSTVAPSMDGTASVGSATTVARSDHKHPTDTSRASQTDLDALETVVSGKANATHSHAISDITNLQTTLDGKAASSHKHTVSQISDLTATATELNYMDGVTSNVQTQLDSKSNSGHGHGNASTSAAGFMTAAMVTKLNGIAEGANKITVDSSLSTSSTNPVRNSVIATAINNATNTINANTQSINAHTQSISALQNSIDNIVEITSEEIANLFKKS